MRRALLVRLLVLAAALSTVATCRPHQVDRAKQADQSDEAAADSSAAASVVARFGDESITADQVDAHILSLPPSERPKPGQDLEQWYTEQVQEMVVDRLLLARARGEHRADDPAFRTAADEARKQIGLQLCLAERRPGVERISEDDLRAAYEERADSLSAPERRSVYQIFLRRQPGALEKIKALRERVLAGEAFYRLATEYSESETRHRRGFVGWMVPGRLPAGFERVIFHLEEGVPSEPVKTREGFHLFYVDQVLPAKHLTFEEARSILGQRLVEERRANALAELDAEISPPAGSLVLDRSQFAEVVKAGDPKAPVLRMGDEKWTLADVQRALRQLMLQQGKADTAPTLELAWQILDQHRRREEIYQHCSSGDQIPADRLEARLDRWRTKALTDAERHRRLVELAKQDEERLRLFYESNVGEFSSSPTWTIRLLRIPIGERPVREMSRLETAAATQSSDLDTLQAELGGEIETLEPLSLAALGRMQPKLPTLLAPLDAGQLAAPYRTEQGLEIAEVEARTEAKPIPFDEVRDRVVARYVTQYTKELYDRLSAKLLDEVDLTIDPDALATLRDAGLPQPDVSVEQLEDLLDRR